MEREEKLNRCPAMVIEVSGPLTETILFRKFPLSMRDVPEMQHEQKEELDPLSSNGH